PHILDRDYGLVGEGLEECDVPVREAFGFIAGDTDGADGLSMTKEWHCDHARTTGALDRAPREPSRGLQVRHVHDRPVEDRGAKRDGPVRWTRILGLVPLPGFGTDVVVVGGQPHDS